MLAARGGLRSGTFRVWTGPYGIYFSARYLGRQLKASIHLERPDKPTQLRWVNFGTLEDATKTLGEPPQGRSLHKWSGVDLGADTFLEFQVLIPRRELRPLADVEDPDAITWIAVPPDGADVQVALLHSQRPELSATIRGVCTDVCRILYQGTLKNGENFWLIQYHVPEISQERLEEARGRATECHRGEPLDPNQHRLVVIGDGPGGCLLFMDVAPTK